MTKILVDKYGLGTFKAFYEGVNTYSENEKLGITNRLTIKYQNGAEVTYKGSIHITHNATKFNQYCINIGTYKHIGWQGCVWPKLNIEFGTIDGQKVDKIEYESGQTGEILSLTFIEED